VRQLVIKVLNIIDARCNREAESCLSRVEMLPLRSSFFNDVCTRMRANLVYFSVIGITLNNYS